MSEFERFTAANKISPIVSAGWTTNGKDSGTTKGQDHPRNWNYMRIRLKNKKEFLLHRDDVSKIKNFSACWDEK